MKLNQEKFEILRKISSKEIKSQRQIAEELQLSLGKINYCLKALKKKGLLKVKNFTKNPNKKGYIYVLTPKGISEKTKLTLNFMQRKMKEYDQLKKELEDINR
tara:strand:- start:186 stop:494 length:309 start_codon:yes stop_codon:yes gene_type:complete